MIGWDELRQQRLAKQKSLGLLPADTKLSPRDSAVPAWNTLSAKKQDEMDLKMATYAAMVDRVDQNIGKLVNSLKTSGQYENTLILFLSDNGGCAEGGVLGRGEFYDVEKRNLDHSNSYGKAWANASNTPFRLYKHFAHEGGTSTPFIMHWPAEMKPQTDWYTEPAQLIDLMPTLIDVAEVKYPETFNGNPIPALDGISLRPAMQGESLNRMEPIFIEHESNAFVRAGDWKLVGRGVSPAKGYQPQKWELYDVKTDRTELNNLAARRRAIVVDLVQKWEAWAKRVGVYPK